MAGIFLPEVPRSLTPRSGVSRPEFKPQSSTGKVRTQQADLVFFFFFVLSLSFDTCKRGMTLPTGPGVLKRLTNGMHGTSDAPSEDSQSSRPWVGLLLL